MLTHFSLIVHSDLSVDSSSVRYLSIFTIFFTYQPILALSIMAILVYGPFLAYLLILAYWHI